MNIESGFENINYFVEEDLATIEINRPKYLNALNKQTLMEIKTLLTGLHSDKTQLKGLILTGSGDKAFIAGADIKEMLGMSSKEAFEFGELGQEVTFLIENFKFPTIACVFGHALGGGLEMALSCDFIFCTKNSQFGLPEVKLGLIPGFGGTQRLSKVIGRAKAKYYIYTGEFFDGTEALKNNLVIDIFDSKEELIENAKKVVKKMSKNSSLAIQAAKKVINQGVDQDNRSGLRLELDQFVSIFGTSDMKEGCAAFMEKRKANFSK